MVWGPKLLNNKQNHSLSALYLIYLHLYLHRYVFACACACVCRCTFMHLCIHMCMYICVPVLYLCLPEVPLRMICFEYWRLFFLLKVSAEAVKRYRSENLTSPQGLLGGSHFMCQTPLFQDKYLTCFVTWLNLHVFCSGLLLSEALCCEMKITGNCLPNAVIQRIMN